MENQLANGNMIDESIFVDQGEYFFDEEFVVPFENSENISPSILLGPNAGKLTRCHSDSKLNQLVSLGTKGQLPIDNFDSNYSNLLFSTGEGEYNSSNQDCSESLIRPNLLNSSLIRRINDKSFKNETSINEYKISYDNDYKDKTQKDTFIPISSLKALDRALDRVVEAMPGNDKSVMKRSIGICTSLQSNQNTTTWARVKGSRESLSRTQNSTNKDSVKIIPVSEKIANDKQSWQAVKEAASTGLTTWGQLKTVARNSRKDDQKGNNKGPANKMMISQQFVDHSGPAHNLRSHSQPSGLSARKMQRFSGTLLEIYMRARYMNTSNSMGNSVTQNFPVSPSMQELADKLKEKRPKGWFDNLLSTNAISALSNDDTQSHVIDSQSSKPDPKNLINFGAQFPPASYLERAKLNPSNQRPLSSAFPQFPLRVTRQQQSVNNRRRSLSSMNSQLNRVNSFRLPTDQNNLINESNANKPVICQNIPPVIEYPGLGPLTIPKPSRLIEAAFLSVTLPDLSFLTQAAADEESNNRLINQSKKTRDIPSHACVCEKCGHRARTIKANKKLAQMKNPRRHNNPDKNKEDFIDRSTSEPDIILGHLAKKREKPKDIDPQIMTLSAITTNTDRDKADAMLRYTNCEYNPDTTTDDNTTTTTTTTSGADFLDMDPNQMGLCGRKSKKSVTFTQNKLKSGSSLPEKEALVMAGIKIIPRNWGLYGGDPGPLAEFSSNGQYTAPKTTNGKSAIRSTNGILLSSSGPKTDIDIRYHALVNDVIKAVQVTVAYFSTMETAALKSINAATGNPNGSQSPQPIPAQPAQSSNALLAVINPLLVLLNDGLLTPARNLFGSKNRSRLWNLIEESCRAGSCQAGVAYHVLCEAINEVKALSTATTNDKLKFKAFVISCLKLKALPMWLNALIANESLLKRYYCDGAFLRQCKTNQRGLYADLMTHLEQLLVYTFDLQLEIEIKKPSSNHTSSNLTPTSMSKPQTPQKSHLNGYKTVGSIGSQNYSGPGSANHSTVSSLNTTISSNSSKSANFMQATAASINRQAKPAASQSNDPNNNSKLKSYRSVTNYSQPQNANTMATKKRTYAPMVTQRQAAIKPVAETTTGHLPQLRRQQSPGSPYKSNQGVNRPSVNTITNKASFQLKSIPQESRVPVHTFIHQRNPNPDNYSPKSSAFSMTTTTTAQSSNNFSRMKADTPPPLPPHQTILSPFSQSSRGKFNKPFFLHLRRSNSDESSAQETPVMERKNPLYSPPSSQNNNLDNGCYPLPPSGIPRPSATSTTTLLANKNSRT